MTRMGSITDVAGIRVGHHQRIDPDATLGSGWATGVTVVLAPPGTVGAVDGRGGAPGTRETDLLDPANSVRWVDAVVLSGGSAYGLATADGVMTWLEEQGRGVALDGGVVPIVPAAVIFDLPVGGWDRRPTAEFGYAAAVAAAGPDGDQPASGSVGAGAGARAGVFKGGVGTASITLDLDGQDVTVGAIVVVNPTGEIIDGTTGLPWSNQLIEEFGLTAPPSEQLAILAGLEPKSLALNTTIAVVATDAVLGPAACRRVAVAAHDGLARAIQPCHTRSTATRCSRWPPGRWRCPRTPTPRRRWCRRPRRSARSARRRPMYWRARCSPGCSPRGRSPGSRRTEPPCPERSHNLIA